MYLKWLRRVYTWSSVWALFDILRSESSKGGVFVYFMKADKWLV